MYKSVPIRCAYCMKGRCDGKMTLYHFKDRPRRNIRWLCERGAKHSSWDPRSAGVINNPNVTMDNGYYMNENAP